MDTFEENKKTGKALSNELQDTQNKVDVRNIPISRVGIKNIRYCYIIQYYLSDLHHTSYYYQYNFLFY